MNWEPRSPNLNPTEPFWDALEKGLKAGHATTVTLSKLSTAVGDA